MPTGVYKKKRGPLSPKWAGGKIKNGCYTMVFAPHHPRASTGNGIYVLEHILVAEAALGRFLPVGAEVHHIDCNGHNNKNKNLVICQSRAYHALLHLRKSAYIATGNTKARKCSHCKKWECDLRTGSINGWSFRHSKCHAIYMRNFKRRKKQEFTDAVYSLQH